MTGPHIGHSFDMDLIFFFCKRLGMSHQKLKDLYITPPLQTCPFSSQFSDFWMTANPIHFPLVTQKCCLSPAISACNLSVCARCWPPAPCCDIFVSHLAGSIASSENVFPQKIYLSQVFLLDTWEYLTRTDTFWHTPSWYLQKGAIQLWKDLIIKKNKTRKKFDWPTQLIVTAI